MATTNEGHLLLRVERAELFAHLATRLAYHERRATELGTEAAEEEKKMASDIDRAETVTDRMAVKSSSNYSLAVNHRDQLLHRGRGHAQKAAAFKFYTEHLPQGEAFFLNRMEAQQLELIPAT